MRPCAAVPAIPALKTTPRGSGRNTCSGRPAAASRRRRRHDPTPPPLPHPCPFRHSASARAYTAPTSRGGRDPRTIDSPIGARTSDASTNCGPLIAHQHAERVTGLGALGCRCAWYLRQHRKHLPDIHVLLRKHEVLDATQPLSCHGVR